jgi:hypothetical protein
MRVSTVEALNVPSEAERAATKKKMDSSEVAVTLAGGR